MLKELMYASLTSGTQAREQRTDKNQCSKPETSSGFSTVLIRTETWACMCQSYSHYNRSNTLKIQLCSICQIDVPCIPHPLLDSCHMCCTACSNEQNTYNSKEKCYNLHYRKTVALSKTQDFQSVCWKAFSAIKAHLTLTLIKANR